MNLTQVKSTYRCEFSIAKKVALTGISISHSKNPKMFAEAYHNNPNYLYGLMPAASAEEAIQLFHANNLCGMNVTAPFKNDILKFVDEQSPEVQAIGAANVVVARNGKLVAYNTDIVGVTESFVQCGITLKGREAVVLGAGGAAQAAVYALQQAGAAVWCANRTESKAVELAAHFGVQALSLTKLSQKIAESTIIVNTLPLDAAILQAFSLQSHHVVLDADYAMQPLREAATKAGAIYIGGLSWVLYQAVPSYYLFTGEEPDIKAMKKFLL